MAQFSVNAQRLDPYKNFKFRVKWGGKYVLGVSKMSSLKRTTEVVEHREGGDPSTSHKSPGRNKYEAITLERGLTQDLNFHDWAGLVWNFGAGLNSEVSLANFRKDLYLEVYNEAGQLVIAYKIYRCWIWMTTNSAGNSGAKPTRMLTTPCAMLDGGLFSPSHLTK